MTDFYVGDLVEAVKGERVIRDRIYAGTGRMFTDGMYLGNPSIFTPSSVTTFRLNGYTLSLVEAATPPLPTEPGLYRDVEGDAWFLGQNGKWNVLTVWGVYEPTEAFSDDPKDCAPFIRLEPVPDTAKKVLERVSEILRGVDLPNEFSGLAREFGIQP